MAILGAACSHLLVPWESSAPPERPQLSLDLIQMSSMCDVISERESSYLLTWLYQRHSRIHNF